MRGVHICSFSALDEIPKRRRSDRLEVLRVLDRAGRFSEFEVDRSLGKTLSSLILDKLIEIDTSIGFPWTKVTLTPAGLALIGSLKQPASAADFIDLPASSFAAHNSPPDTTLVKSTRPATCAVCRQVVTASIVLPDQRACCEFCCCIALRAMIDDAAGGKGPVRP